MLSTDTILIATPLDRLISGAVTSSDVINSKRVIDKVEKLAKDVVTGQPAIKKAKSYNYKAITENLELELTADQFAERSEKLLSNTDMELADLIPRIVELSELMRELIPYNHTTDVLGVHTKEASMTEKLIFLRMYGAVDDPLNVLARVSDNSFTKAEMDTVKRAYPELVEGFQMMLNGHLMDLGSQGKEVVGRNKSLGIRRFFGESIARAPTQAELDVQQGQQQAAARSTRVKNFEAGSRMTPESQKDLGE